MMSLHAHHRDFYTKHNTLSQFHISQIALPGIQYDPQPPPPPHRIFPLGGWTRHTICGPPSGSHPVEHFASKYTVDPRLSGHLCPLLRPPLSTPPLLAIRIQITEISTFSMAELARFLIKEYHPCWITEGPVYFHVV